MDSTLETPVNAQPEAPASSQTSSDTKKAEVAQIKGLLAEARNTKEMLEDFQSSVLTGSYTGGQMLKIAKGLAFLDAILGQNKAHIKNLQERLGE